MVKQPLTVGADKKRRWGLLWAEAGMSDVQVLGLCRWSYPAAPGAFRKDAGDSLAEISASLYSPERLKLRLLFLEYVLLPCLRSQIDQDFELVLLMGDKLPEPYRSQILRLVEDVPQVVPAFRPEGIPHLEVCAEVLRSARNSDRSVVAEFRLDDDDAVAIDFVKRTRKLFSLIKPIFEERGNQAIDFNKGFILNVADDSVDITPVVARYWTPGLVVFLPSRGETTVFNFHHARMWQRVPMLSWPRKPMFVRGAHGQNDSSVSENPHNATPIKYDSAEIPQIMRDRFGIDLKVLEAAWTSSRNK